MIQEAFVDAVLTPQGWWLCSGEGLAQLDEGPEEVPALPEGARLRRVLLPMEFVSLHPLLLPLHSAKLVDAQIVQTALSDASGLAWDGALFRWRLRRVEDGLVGIAVALPAAFKERLDLLAPRSVGIDAFAVLDAQRQGDAPQAVIVEDEEGIFLGVWDGELWRGASRRAAWREASWELDRLLDAMGWDGKRLCGELSEPSQKALSERLARAWQGRLVSQAPARAQRVAEALQQAPWIELRTGDWAPEPKEAFWQRWRRAGALALGVFVAWLGVAATDLIALQRERNTWQDRLEKAFARALPGVPIVDPIAQLQQAAGGAAKAVHGARFWRLLQAVAAARPEQLDAIEFDAAVGLTIAGKAKSLSELDALQKRLSEQWPSGVRLLDSSLGEDGVRWRIQLVLEGAR